MVLDIFTQHKASIIFFGLADHPSYFENLNNLDAEALPLDENWQPRAMYYQILQTYLSRMVSNFANN